MRCARRRAAQGRGAARGPVVRVRWPASRTATPVLGYWLLPLPTIDPLVVARSGAALAAYGPKFRYSHYAGTKTLRYAAGGAAGVAALGAGRPGPAGAQPAARAGCRRARGRTRRGARKSWFTVDFVGEAGGRTVHTRVSGGDPGYTETAKMLARVGALPGPRRQPADAPARSPPPRRWATTCWPACRRPGSASRSSTDARTPGTAARALGGHCRDCDP